MIVVGPIANFMRNGRPVRSTHLISDLTGILGSKELMKFGMAMGLKAGWLQAWQTPHEHFDLMGSKIEEAVKAGAVRVDRYRLVAIIREKRGYIERKEAHDHGNHRHHADRDGGVAGEAAGVDRPQAAGLRGGAPGR